MEYKKVFEKFEGQEGFIKETDSSGMEGSQKAALNRKGNALYNAGEVETARRIFLTTGYSDGISRIGDYYRDNSRYIDALRMYWTAPDKNKSEPIIQKLSEYLQQLLHEGEEEGLEQQ